MTPHDQSHDPALPAAGVASPPPPAPPGEAGRADELGAPELDALRALPRLTASPGFTPRLLLRLDDRERQRADRRWPSSPRWAWASAALLLVAALGVAGWWGRVEQRRALRGQLEGLQAERRELSSELQRLDAREVLYLGSDDRFDYLFDPSGHRMTTTPARGEIVPASAVY
jgi:hypothetical protein